jgi:glycosyltransferase involved in cell wall biosynthesis
MLAVHRTLGTWVRAVDAYITLSEFARQKFIQGGIPAQRLAVKPNFVHPDPGLGGGRGQYALYVGRLSPEKGVETLLAAWEQLGNRVPLKIVGDGPLAGRVAEATQKLRRAEWLGTQTREQVLTLMKGAHFLVFPSVCYENLPGVILEAYAVGLPVIGSNLGSMVLLIDAGRTGLRFKPGDPKDLAAQVEWILAHPRELARMRRESRAEFEANYTAEKNYSMLMDIYERAGEVAKAQA